MSVSSGRQVWPLWPASVERTYLMPALIRDGESAGRPREAAIMSARLNPMPLNSPTREYGSFFIRSTAPAPHFL